MSRPSTAAPSIIGYEYQYKELPNGSYGTWKDVGADTEAEVTGLTPGKSYTFAVRARNSVGRGDPAGIHGTAM